MKLNRWIRMGLFGAAMASMAMACTVNTTGDDDDDGKGGASASSGNGNGSGNGSGQGSSGSGSNDYYCCINGAGYTCPNDAAVIQCIGFDIEGCMLMCGFDDVDCQDACFDQLLASTPDPSACTSDASVDCSNPSGGGGPTGGGGGLCIGDWDGDYCDVDSDCPSNNCFNDKCYANAEGNPCDVDSDCTSNNCFQNCCYGNGEGEPCDVDSDCTSNNCYQNECQ